MLSTQLLETLAVYQNLNIAPDISLVTDKLKFAFENYTELEFRSDGKRVDLITLSNQLTIINTFFNILEGRGVNISQLPHLKALIRFGAGKVVGMKLPVAGPINGGEIYIRGALPLTEVKQFLKRYGVQPKALETIEQLGHTFGKTHTHMLGTDVTNPLTFTVFFTIYLTQDDINTDQECLKHALNIVGIHDEAIHTFLPLHLLLGTNRPKTLFFSWGIVDGEPVPQAKIDYEDVRLGVAAEVVNVVSTAKQADVLMMWGEQLELKKASYAGVVVAAAGLKTVRVYFTRRLSRYQNSKGASINE